MKQIVDSECPTAACTNVLSIALLQNLLQDALGCTGAA